MIIKMNISTELIIPCNKKNNLIIAFIVSPLAAIASWILFVHLSQNSFSSGYWILIGLPIKIVLSIIFVMSLLAIILTPFQKINLPNAIFNQDGIWVKHFGFILWNDINEITKYTYGTPMEIIGIQVKDPESISKRASFFGKCIIFYSKVFGYYHISIASLEVNIDEIICFANKYMK